MDELEEPVIRVVVHDVDAELQRPCPAVRPPDKVRPGRWAGFGCVSSSCRIDVQASDAPTVRPLTYRVSSRIPPRGGCRRSLGGSSLYEDVRAKVGESLKPLVHRRIHMGTKSVRLDDDVYERVKAHKREDETFSDTVARLIEDVSLLDLADEDEEYDAERAAEQKEALKRTARADAESAAKLDEKGS